MDGIAFLNKLIAQLPAEAALKAAGVSAEILDRSVYPLIQTMGKVPAGTGNDTILELLELYDLSKVEIGMLTFNAEVKEDASYYYIGKFEVDILVKNKHTGVIQLLEYDQPTHVICDCAKDSNSFLEPIAMCDEFLWECLLDDTVFVDDKKRLAKAEVCAVIAGGEHYSGFYEMFVG